MFRAPSTSPSPIPSATFTPPSMDFLAGPWHVTHSTLPMWKSNKNIVITYTALSSPPGSIDDLVTYNPLSSNKRKTVRGVDTPDATIPAKYQWRGKGLLKIASSQWEVLGYGDEEGGWAVTYFQKTLFTPAGIDVYSRGKGGLSEGLIRKIREAMRTVQEEGFKKLEKEIFEIRHDR